MAKSSARRMTSEVMTNDASTSDTASLITPQHQKLSDPSLTGLETLVTLGDDLLSGLRDRRRPRVFILSGPSGVGKDTVLADLRACCPDAHYPVTVTTRPRRENEIHGVHYIFMSPVEFQTGVDAGDFLEHAHVYENRYGVLRAPVVDALIRGEDVVAKVDVQGAATIRRQIAHTISIFIAPESMTQLLRQIQIRKTETAPELAKRFTAACHELEQAGDFDYIIFNEAERLSATVERVRAIIEAERRRVNQSTVELSTLRPAH